MWGVVIVKTILIVEDEIPISQVLKVYLQKANFNTVHAFDGEEAIEMFTANKPALVLLDVMLPRKAHFK